MHSSPTSTLPTLSHWTEARRSPVRGAPVQIQASNRQILFGGEQNGANPQLPFRPTVLDNGAFASRRQDTGHSAIPHFACIASTLRVSLQSCLRRVNADITNLLSHWTEALDDVFPVIGDGRQP